MADSELKLKSSRRALSRAASRISARDDGLARATSRTYLEDNSLSQGYEYHADQDVVGQREDTRGGSWDGSNKENEDEGGDEEKGSERDNSEDVISSGGQVEDVEAGLKIEPTKSARSVRDPNLVTWKGPDDLENPINWTQNRKWTALLISRFFAT